MPTQMPASQASVRVQALPSSQPVPSGLAGLLQTPDAGLQMPAVWHWSAAVHTTGLAPTQAPAAQVSVRVQASPSSHGAPLGLEGVLQTRDAGLQTPAVWHWSAAVHTTGLAPTQAPAAQVSVCVQASPSSHGAPLGLAGLLQTPDAELQTPTAWHWSAAVHTTGLAPTQAPAAQVSVRVQASPSSHGAPLGLEGVLQTRDAGLQTPAVWHWSAAVHTTGLAPTQAPAAQVSVCVQASPSSHGAPLGLAGLLQTPDAGLQTPAVWHWSAAVHTTGLAPTQAPAAQVSVRVQASPSSHGAPLGLAGLLHTPDAGLQTPAVWHWPAVVPRACVAVGARGRCGGRRAAWTGWGARGRRWAGAPPRGGGRRGAPGAVGRARRARAAGAAGGAGWRGSGDWSGAAALEGP